MTVFAKREAKLRFWLQDQGFSQALAMMDFAQKVHNGVRKDGTTPEFYHQISIANYVRTLAPSLIHPEATMSAIFGHDLGEPPYNMAREVYEPICGPIAAEAIWCMTKKQNGVVFPEDVVFDNIARNAVASVAKPGDRLQNLESMIGVFVPPKQRSYIGDVRRCFLPAMKISRKLFPQQEPAYENMRHTMIVLCRTIEAGLDIQEQQAA